jgi:hypothetical protein
VYILYHVLLWLIIIIIIIIISVPDDFISLIFLVIMT